MLYNISLNTKQADGNFHHESENNNITGLLRENSSTEYILAEKEYEISEFCESFDFSNYRKVVLLPLNNGYFINRVFYNRAAEIFRQNMNRFWKNKITLISLSSRWYSNIFKNLPFYGKKSSVSEINTDKPVFIAGAGESLESALPVIKKYRERITLIAIDTAVSTLMHYSIKPDYILAVEAQFYNMFDFYSCRNSGIPVICDISSYPQTLRITGGKNYFFFSEFSTSNFLKTMENKNLLPEKIPPLGSVGVIAVYIATRITDNPVIYSGLDFSFIPGKSHSKDSPFIILTSHLGNRTGTSGNYSFCIREDNFSEKDINGKKVVTNSNLRSYSKSLTEILSKTDRIYSLFPSGIVKNRSTIQSEEEFKRLVNHPFTSKPSVSHIPGSESLSSFYSSEHSKLEKIISTAADLLNSRTGSSSFDSLREMLYESDYITEDFPETSLPENISPPYLKRLLLSCYRYERIIRQIISTLQ